MIDLGNASLNVPVYNGGLFVSDPETSDMSLEAESARFLNKHKVADRFLARAVELLARATDEKRHDRVFIDYKSLGVRQLGSIYEGLLEFKVRIASRKLAIVKEKGREIYSDFNDLGDREKDRAERQGTLCEKRSCLFGER